jgi:hypothetical protein
MRRTGPKWGYFSFWRSVPHFPYAVTLFILSTFPPNMSALSTVLMVVVVVVTASVTGLGCSLKAQLNRMTDILGKIDPRT